LTFGLDLECRGAISAFRCCNRFQNPFEHLLGILQDSSIAVLEQVPSLQEFLKKILLVFVRMLLIGLIRFHKVALNLDQNLLERLWGLSESIGFVAVAWEERVFFQGACWMAKRLDSRVFAPTAAIVFGVSPACLLDDFRFGDDAFVVLGSVRRHQSPRQELGSGPEQGDTHRRAASPCYVIGDPADRLSDSQGD